MQSVEIDGSLTPRLARPPVCNVGNARNGHPDTGTYFRKSEDRLQLSNFGLPRHMSKSVRDSVTAGQQPERAVGGFPGQSAAYASDMPIGRKIKERRVELGLSVRRLADMAGMARTTLYDIERGDQQSSTRLHTLCKVLGLNPEWLDTGRPPRLVSGYSASAALQYQNPSVESVGQERTSPAPAGSDMAQLARESLEVAVLLSTLAEPMRSQVITMIRALAAKPEKPEIAEETGEFRLLPQELRKPE